MANLISVHEAQEIVLSAFQAKKTQRIPIENSFEYVLAEDINAPFDLPPFSNSSMDGFAVHSRDVLNATQQTPVILPVFADIPAGYTQLTSLPAGHAARIMTGAPLPLNADAVIPVENTDQYKNFLSNNTLPDNVSIFAPALPGQNIRLAGQDVHKGQKILQSGKTLTPQAVGMLISLGFSSVMVYPRPCIAVFSSGDELLSPGEPITQGKIYDSNRFTLTGLLKAAGCEVIQLGIARDNPEDIYNLLKTAHQFTPDLLLSTAGVSVGAFDYVRQIIETHGEMAFWRVNMRPGKPIAFGIFESIPYIGLPGNPVSAFIGCVVFVLPLLRKLQNLPPYTRKTLKARLAETLESDGRESYLRCNIKKENEQYVATLTGHQGSGNLFSLVQANAIMIIPAGITQLPAGAEVQIWLLETLESE